MPSRKIQNLTRVISILVFIIMIIQPWFFAFAVDDPYVFCEWNMLAAGVMASCLLSVLAVFYRVKQGQVPFIKPLLLIFLLSSFMSWKSGFLPTLRSTVAIFDFLVMILFFRLTSKNTDYPAVVSTMSVSGAAMAVYCILQYMGQDCIKWSGPGTIVGTLANPNYVGIFLIISVMVTFGALLDIPLKKKYAKISFLLMFLLQISAILLCKKTGVYLSFSVAFITFLFFRLRRYSWGNFFCRRPFVSGLVLAIVVTLCYGAAYYSIDNYNWDSITVRPNNISFVTRSVLWKMGFDVFLSDPFLGKGPGQLTYIMQKNRPPNGDILGIFEYNTDPHSVPITILAELGFIGFWFVTTFFVYIFGLFMRNMTKEKYEQINSSHVMESSDESSYPEKHFENPFKQFLYNLKNRYFQRNSIWCLPWFNTFIASLIVYLSYKSGFIAITTAIYSIPFIIAFCGVFNSFTFESKEIEQCNPGLNVRCSFISALSAWLFYSLYNNSFEAIPVLGIVLVLISCCICWNMEDVRWSKSSSWYTILYLLLPFFFAFAAYTFQLAHHTEQQALYKGRRHLTEKRPKEALENFMLAIHNNPKSIKAYHGAALAYDKMGKTNKSQEMYKKLDSIVPNAFGANYYLSMNLIQSGQILEAHRFALKNLERERLPSSFELLVYILNREGKTAEAVKVASEGLRYVPHLYNEEEAADRLRLLAAKGYIKLGDYNKGSEYLFSIKSALKNRKDAVMLKAFILSKAEKNAEALDIFEKLLQTDPENIVLLNSVGYLLCELNTDLDRAQILLESAYSKVKGKNPVSLDELLTVANSLGVLYWRRGILDKAEELLLLSYKDCPEDWKEQKVERKKILDRFYKENKSLLEEEKRLKENSQSLEETFVPANESDETALPLSQINEGNTALEKK